MTAGGLACQALRALSDSRRSHLSGAQGHLGVLSPAELGELVQDQRELIGQRGVLPAELVLDQRNVTQYGGRLCLGFYRNWMDINKRDQRDILYIL